MDTFGEILKIITPALSALAGGLVVILGNKVTHNLQKDTKGTDFLKDQIERTYLLTLESIEWLQKQQAEISYYLDNNTSIAIQNKEQRSNEIRMLIKLYFPELSNHCDDLDKYEKLYYNGITLGYKKPAEFDASKLKASISKSSELLLITHINLQDSLHEKMNLLCLKK